jgi:predicted permease
MHSLMTDLKVAGRRLLADRAFLAATCLTLALCIGANVTIFTVVDSVLLEPLPFPEPERIVTLWNAYPAASGGSTDDGSNGVPDFLDRRALTEVFEEVAIYDGRGRSLELDGTPQRVNAWEVSPSFFPLLGAQAALGRTFSEAEGELGHNQVVVLSHGLFEQLFGSGSSRDAGALGFSLRLDGLPFTVVGVMPKGFAFIDDEVRLWTPAAHTAEEKLQYHSNNWGMIARLRPGISLERAQAEIDALNLRNMERTPELRQLLIDAGFHTRMVVLAERLVRDVRGILFLLWGGVGFVLLIGCVNVANLMLVRSSARARELATRVALGAPRRRLARLLLVEGLLLSLASGALGLLAGAGGLRALRGLGIEDLPRAGQIQIDASTLLFALLLTVAVGVLVTLIPLFGAWRTNLSLAFRGLGRTGTAGRRARLVRKLLVAGQVALSLVLLVGAGLLATSFGRLLDVDPGFELDSVLTGSVAMGEVGYPDSKAQGAFIERTLERLRAVPGVAAAGVTNQIPLGGGNSDSVILAEGSLPEPGESLISPTRSVASPGYFEAMGIDVLEGRSFEQRDVEGSLPVIIVDRRLAKRFWPDGAVLGKRVIVPSSAEDLLRHDDAPKATVIGIVESVSMQGPLNASDGENGAYYFPVAQASSSFVTFALRVARNAQSAATNAQGAATDARSLIEPVRRVLAEIDPEMPLFDVRTQRERLARSVSDRRTPMLLVAIFAATALVLAAVGIYGMLAYQVELRTREIGIRTALGSSAGRTVGLVIAEGAMIMVAGLGLGLLGAAALGRVIASQLYEVSPTEPSVLAIVVALLCAVAVAASLVPARRATRVDPVVALMTE